MTTALIITAVVVGVAAHFVVLLDDNTFEQWPVEECTKVK